LGSLRIEAKAHGVRVSVLCPGAIRTPILKGGKFGRMRMNEAARAELDKMWERMRPMPVEELAPKVARAVERNDAFIVFPAWWRLVWYLERVSPALTSKLCELGYARLHERALTEQHAKPEVARGPRHVNNC
jgi:short-subunit dehydrogenase